MCSRSALYVGEGPESALCGPGFLRVKIIAIDMCALRVLRALAV
jgi:hypothetical protein